VANIAVKPCPIYGGPHAVHERWLDTKTAPGGPFQLARCTRCSFVFTNLSGADILEANAGFDDGATAGYSSIQSAADRLWFDHICTRMTPLAGAGSPRVLDVGCGNGLLLQRFRERGWEIHGVDLSAWAEPAAAHVGFRLFRGTIESAALPAGHFDAVTSTSTLEHIPNLVAHIAAILRVLRPGGQAYFAGMPNYGSIAVRTGTSAFHHNRPPRHASWFTPRTLRLLFSHPTIREHIAAVSVRTYGVPELHRLYNHMLALRRRSGAVDGRTAAAGIAKAEGATPGALRRLVDLNYYVGRPLGLGDKLEVTVTAT
jgi:SAM-dependent methyltransferase